MPTHDAACRARTPCNTPSHANKSSKASRWAPAKQSLLYAFLAPFASGKGQPCNLTAMNGGRWLVPQHQWDDFYRLYASECSHVAFSLVQLSGDVFPLLVDVDTNKDPGAIANPTAAFFQVLSAFISAIEDCGLDVSLLVPEVACFRCADNLHVVFTTLHVNKMQHMELRRRALKYLHELKDGVAHNWDDIVDQATTLKMPGSIKAKDGALKPQDGFYAPCRPLPPFDLDPDTPLDLHTVQYASLWRPQGTQAHPHIAVEDPNPAPPARTNPHPPDPIKDADLSRLCDLVHWNVRAASYPDWVRALTLFKEEGAARGDPDLYKVLAIERTNIPGITKPGDGDAKWDQISVGRAQRSVTFGTLHYWATGVGMNGKTLTFGSLIKYVWGGYFGSLSIVALTNKRAGPRVATPELDKVRLSRRAVAVEPETGLVLNCSLLKQLSGGDQVESRALYGQLVDYLPQYKVDLLCNNLPYLDGSDGGTKRRVRLQAWKSRFRFGLQQPDPDNHLYPAEPEQVLKDRMMAWRDDFVLHLIHRYDPYYIEMPPQTMIELSNEYLDENNPFAAFVQQFVEPSNQPGAHFTIKQAKLLWPLFQDFLKSQGRSKLLMPPEAEFRNALSSALGAPYLM